MYNTFRDNKFSSECWKWSSNQQDILNRMDENNLKDWLEWQQFYAEKVVVKIGSMPYWLSSSDDWSVMSDESWREFMTHPPDNYDTWNASVKAVVKKIKNWGIHPYYEIWNEPDGIYWQGNDADLLELFKQTAISIKEEDPMAKVGGFGMHTWWRSADPQLANEQQKFQSPVMGFLPDTIPEKYAILYKLMDSVAGSWADEEVPLDFISYHFFNWNSFDLVHTAEQIRDKLNDLGYNETGTKSGLKYPEFYISEWQTTYHIEEQLFQPGLFLRILSQLETAGIEMNSIAAINDFGSNENEEFNNDWGMFSQNALIKPVFKGLLLLSELTKQGVQIESNHNPELDVLASLSEDTLRILVSNYTMPVWWYHNYYRFAWSCFERLLYDSTSVYNAMDYMNAGMSSIYWGNSNSDYGSVDSIIKGELIPPEYLPADMINSLNLSRDQYVYDSMANAINHNISFNLNVDNDSLTVFYNVIDSNQNNIIFLYDSLKNEVGYSHQRAIDSLQSCTYPGGCFGIGSVFDSVKVTGNQFNLTVNPNTILFLVIPGVQIQTVGSIEKNLNSSRLVVFPNPITSASKIQFEHEQRGEVILTIYDNVGRLVLEKNLGLYEAGNRTIPIPHYKELKRGAYYLKLKTPAQIFSSTILLK